MHRIWVDGTEFRWTRNKMWQQHENRAGSNQPQTAEANPSLRLRAAVVTIARQQAIKVVKRQYQVQGLEVRQFSRRDYIVAAKESLREHPELIAQAAKVVEQWRLEGFCGKRAMK